MSLVACKGKSEIQAGESGAKAEVLSETQSGEEIANTADEVSEEKKDDVMVAVLSAEYLAGVWNWQEEKSPDSITQMRCFELKADGTGKILQFVDEKMIKMPLTWSIEDHGDWSSVHVFADSDKSLWNCNYELNGNDLVDLTGSNYFTKEVK